MTRGATGGDLPEQNVGHLRSKHPQPVIDNLLPTNVQESSVLTLSRSSVDRPRTSTSQRSSFNRQRSDSDDDGLHMQRPARASTARPGLARAKSDFGSTSLQRQKTVNERGRGADPAADMNIRHGWESQLKNEEVTRNLSENFFMYYEDKRHETAGNLPSNFDPKSMVTEWRMKDRLKTVSALLAVCLNVGVDPPDVIKTNPCARLECWVDPIPADSTNQSTNNSNAQIGKNLQSQYENLSLRTRYKVVLDPTIDELKKYTQSLRRTAHSERILFHYNGHGVPKPTSSGEVWSFNRSFTQYIPMSLADLQDWVGAPGLWVWDCSTAAGIIKCFMDGARKLNANQQEALKRDPNRAQQQPIIKWEDCIHLAACRENEVLPTNPELPADLFTSCLTTPIVMAVRFFILQNPLTSTSGVSLAQARNIPGKVSERRTPLGELNWIFTAITDTIAWNCLDKPLFKKLFRQDLMVAALFRNFLLAQRIMRIYHCHPQSYPTIPDTHDHPLWRSWDLAVEMILAQLPKLIDQQKANEALADRAPSGTPSPQPELEYQHSDFFADQLTAFEVYLSSAPSNPGAAGYAKPPEQLPIVLQVLLSQVHRLRALILLSKFLDLGPWAVNLALSIGIFPYVLKLLQSQALELKAPMVFIWARILAVDQTCQTDLLKDQGFSYFTNILLSTSGIPIGNVPEHRAMCTFVIAMFCKDFKPGKQAVLETNPEIIANCLNHLQDMENPLLRQFSLLCLSNICRDNPAAKDLMMSADLAAHCKILDRSHDPVPEARAACLHALASFVATGPITKHAVREESMVASVLISTGMDGSIMVRKELTVFYSTFIKRYLNRFLVAAWDQLVEERDKRNGVKVSDDDFMEISATETARDIPGYEGSAHHMNGHNGARSRDSRNDVGEDDRDDENDDDDDKWKLDWKDSKQLSRALVYRAMWRQCLSMSVDPHPEVARNASIIVDYVIGALLDSPLAEHAHAILDELEHYESAKSTASLPSINTSNKLRPQESRPETPPSPAPSTASKADGYFGLSRTASVAAAMKNLIGWGQRPPNESTTTPGSPTHTRRGSTFNERSNYKSRPLTPHDAASLPPDALDTITGPPHQPPAKVPTTPFYKGRDLSDGPQIPLESDFFTWSSSYFREPQMRVSEADEPGSKDYNERLWRRNRNDGIIAMTQPLKEAAGSQRWDVPCGYFGIGAAPVKMVFHQFENHLVTSDDRDSIAIWDWEQAQQLSRFSNGNPPGTRVTDIRFINEDDTAMLMTGSSDGVIKIYRHYEDIKRIELVSGFRALSDLLPSDQQSAGLVFDWQQGQGKALVAGDDRVIRVWQVGQELCVADIKARSSSCITSLTSDQVEGHVFVAGFGNGGVRAYDQRLPSHSSMIMDWTNRSVDHHSWVVGVHLQRGGLRELVSAESSGGIRLWDIRMKAAVARRDPEHSVGSSAGGGGGSGAGATGAGVGAGSRSSSHAVPRSLRALSVHEHAPVFATGGRDHTIRVYNMDLKPLSSFEPYMSYLRLANTPRSAPITATAFHPHRMMLACGAVNDGHVNLFKCDAEPDEKTSGSGIVEEWRG